MSNAIALLPSHQEFQTLKEICSLAIKSGYLPSQINTPEKAVIIALKGRELGVAPMVAFAHINVISGKPCMSSELMLSQIYRYFPKTKMTFLENTHEKCIIEIFRNNNKNTFSFTIQDAQQAGLLNKDPWKKYPQAMLQARCIAKMARALFPDALNGVSYTPEELGADVELDDNGGEAIKDVTPKNEVKQKNEVKPFVKNPHGDYIIKIGDKIKGKKLSELSNDHLNKIIEKIDIEIFENERVYTDEEREFVETAMKYLKFQN